MSDLYYVDKTKMGKGLFSKRLIKKGETILKFEGPEVTEPEARRLDLENYGTAMGNALQIGNNKYLYIGDPGRIVNHSCNPNSGIVDDINLIALKDIPKDKEITFDYSTTMDDGMWTMECICGEKNCRGVIKDFIHLPKELREKYLALGIVQNFIKIQFEK